MKRLSIDSSIKSVHSGYRDYAKGIISIQHKIKFPELKTLEWINFNPDFLIRISTVETFHFGS